MIRTFPSLIILLVLISNFVAGQSIERIGLAKSAEQFGRDVIYTIHVESFSDDTLRFVQVNDNLDAAFGAGNYSVSSTNATGFLCANPDFDGSSNTELLLNNSGCFLPIRGTAEITFRVSIETLTDMGNGVGKYSNSATGVGRLITSTTAVDDISDWGTDPDPNGNSDPNELGENDPTLTDILQNPVIGISKSAVLNGNEVTFRFYLENFGNRDLEEVQIIDDLDAVFGAGNYSITSAPSFFDDPGTLIVNAGFDGSADVELLASGTLSTTETAGIQITVNVTNVVDLGKGLGVYENQAKATAQSSTRKKVEDLSDDGTDPDPNGNGNPREEGERGIEGENDPTKITIGQQPVIGVAKNVTVSADSVSIDLYLENLGNTVLSNISLTENLKSVFGSGNFNIRSTQILDAASTLVLNSSFNENTNFELLQTSSTLGIGEVDTIQIIVENIIRTDQGFGTGVYKNQVFATATAPGGSTTSDYSDSGTDADPNGNGNPNEAGENDITSFSITSNPKIGIALEYRPGSTAQRVELIYHVENLGNEPLSNITVSHNLNAVYGAGNYTHLVDPAQTSGSPTFYYNTAFNGNTNVALLNAGSTLAPGETSSFKIEHLVSNITDQGYGSGIYQSQVTVNGTAPDNSTVFDVSHQGKEPDPNGNGEASDAGESDATVIDLNAAPFIGIALDANVSGNVVTFDVYLENLGNLDYSDLSVTANLDQVFGAGNYTLSTPSFIDNPGTITLNPSYDGGGNKDLIDFSNSTFAESETAQIRIIVTVDSINNVGLGLGNYSAQFSVSAINVHGGTNEDQSDFGTDPDPNGNSNADEAGENDKTTFTLNVGSATGISQNITSSGNDITFDLYVENFASGAMSNLSIIHDLDAVFGQNNYVILNVPTLIIDPGTLVLNGAFDGSSNTNLLVASSTLAGNAIAQIQFKIQITNESATNVYSSQAKIGGLNPNGFFVVDLSDDGTDPDPNGNDDPTEVGENDASSVFKGAIGHAFYATVDGNLITYHVTLENLGKVQISSMTLTHQLISVFGFGNYSKASGPFTDNSSAITLNSSFDGLFSPSIITSGTLKPGEKANITYQINVTNVTNQGSGFGVYPYQSTITATDVSGAALTDLSDFGFIPDSNGNGFAGDAGENDVTQVTIGEEANIGVALTASVSGKQVTFDYYFENFGNSTLSNLDFLNNLNQVFGAGNYSISQAPTFIDDPGTITLNSAFDGSGNQSLTNSGSTLGFGDTGQIRVVVDVLNIINNVIGVGNYTNQVLFSGEYSGGSSKAYDLSDKGIDPDPNGNDIPYNLNENDPTDFKVNFSSIGLAQEASTDCDAVITFKYYLKNLGTSMLDSIGLEHNLDGLFGVGQYTIVEAPSYFTEVRGLVLDNSFNGSSKTNLLLPSSTMNIIGAGSEIITMKVKLLNTTQTTYKSGAKITATDNTSGHFFDLSDSGINPDANNNYLANEVGENDSTVINTYAPLVASITSQTNVSCNGLSNGSVNLSVTGGTPISGGGASYTYSWSNSVSTEDLSSLVAGTYSVVVTDANSCTATASVTITQPATLVPSITSSSNVSCNGLSNGSVNLSVTGGTAISGGGANYTYSWSNSVSTEDLSSLVSGTYSVVVTDANSCTATASVTITQPAALVPSITSSTNVSCNGLSNGSVNLSVTGGTAISGGGANYTYSWSNSASTEDLSSLVSGTYSVVVTDANSCTATASVTITQPATLVPSITSSTNVSCNGLSNGSVNLSVTGGTPISGGGASYTYSWSNSASTEDLSSLVAGTYSVVVTDANSCTATASVTITQPVVLLASISSSTNATCNGFADGTVNLSVTGGTSLPSNYSYSWSNSSITEDLSGLAAGTYSVVVTDANSCTATASVTITEPVLISFNADSVSHPTNCLGSNGSIAFTGTNISDGSLILNYKKDGNVTSQSVDIFSSLFTLSNLTAGVYSDFSMSVNNCEAVFTTPQILQDPTIIGSASNTGPYEEGQKIDLNATGGSSYTWTGPNGFFSTLQNPSITNVVPANSGVYSVTVSLTNNCSATATTEVMISCSSQALSYYLIFADGNPQIIAPLVPNLQVQASDRPMSVIAVTACQQPIIESVYMQITGTTNQWFQTDNDMPFNLHDFYNVNNGDVLAPNHYIFTSYGYDQDDRLGNIITGPDFIHFDLIWSGRNITQPTSSVNEVCVGTTFSVSAISTNQEIHPFGVGNMYQVFLSDPEGDFMKRTLIGSGTNPSSINCDLPLYLKSSEHYKIMVISTSPVVASLPSTADLKIIGNDLLLKSPTNDISSTLYNGKAINVIKAENAISNAAKGFYSAGRFIELNAGFQVSGNSVFEAKIENNCVR
jgi:hypothetical protein